MLGRYQLIILALRKSLLPGSRRMELFPPMISSSSRCYRIQHSSAAFQECSAKFPHSPFLFHSPADAQYWAGPVSCLNVSWADGRRLTSQSIGVPSSSQCTGMCTQHVTLLSGKSGILSTQSFFRQGCPVLSLASHSYNC